MSIELYNDDCLERLKIMEDNSVDAIVTDPPAGINFMSMDRDWETNLKQYKVIFSF